MNKQGYKPKTARGQVQAKERPARAHARERKGRNEVMDNAMRRGVFYFVFFIYIK
jgi:hypothetical protein